MATRLASNVGLEPKLALNISVLNLAALIFIVTVIFNDHHRLPMWLYGCKPVFFKPFTVHTYEREESHIMLVLMASFYLRFDLRDLVKNKYAISYQEYQLDSK